jgi:hypothetical protein
MVVLYLYVSFPNKADCHGPTGYPADFGIYTSVSIYPLAGIKDIKPNWGIPHWSSCPLLYRSCYASLGSLSGLSSMPQPVGLTCYPADCWGIARWRIY